MAKTPILGTVELQFTDEEKEKLAYLKQVYGNNVNVIRKAIEGVLASNGYNIKLI